MTAGDFANLTGFMENKKQMLSHLLSFLVREAGLEPARPQ